MRSFESWLSEQAAPEPDLPDGVWELNGKFVATCKACERTYELYFDPSEFDNDMSYCGGGPSCCP